MKTLFLGDVVGRAGRESLAQTLPSLKKKYKPDLVIINADNLAHGLGVTQKTVEEMIGLGVDLMTSGNHIFSKRETRNTLEDFKIPLLRPLNYPLGVPGRGFFVLPVGTGNALVVNLNGRVFVHENFEDPFAAVEKLLEDFTLSKEEAAKENKTKVEAIIVDFHAEATSEKKALGWFLDGRVSVVLGTHTHVQTNDQRVLPKGTAYISDVGMVGVENSILGASPESIMPRFLKQLPSRMEPAYGGAVEVNGIFLETNNSTGLSKNIEKIRERVVEY